MEEDSEDSSSGSVGTDLWNAREVKESIVESQQQQQQQQGSSKSNKTSLDFMLGGFLGKQQSSSLPNLEQREGELGEKEKEREREREKEKEEKEAKLKEEKEAKLKKSLEQVLLNGDFEEEEGEEGRGEEGKRKVEQQERVKLNVGGRVFETYISTLQKYPHTLLATMFDSRNSHLRRKNKEGTYFFDRNSEAFSAILDWYRNGVLSLPPNLPLQIIRQEIDFFQIPLSPDSLHSNNNNSQHLKLSHKLRFLTLSPSLHTFTYLLCRSIQTLNLSLYFWIRFETFFHWKKGVVNKEGRREEWRSIGEADECDT